MNKVCERCGLDKHVHDYYMRVGVHHKIKTVKNTRDVCKVCTEIILAERKAEAKRPISELLSRAWV